AVLAYEGARKSMVELIEYEPTQAEAMVTGLVTEFSAYRFLTRCFDADTDIRGRRLALRAKAYDELVPKLCHQIRNSTEDDWENARTTAIDLERLYFEPKTGRGGGAPAAAGREGGLEGSAESVAPPVTLVPAAPASRHAPPADDSLGCAVRADSLEANIGARTL